jgi:hypothetical protein
MGAERRARVEVVGAAQAAADEKYALVKYREEKAAKEKRKGKNRLKDTLHTLGRDSSLVAPIQHCPAPFYRLT